MSQSRAIIIKELAVFGLSEIEARVYAHLVHVDTESALHISKSLEIPRTSVYDALRKLAERGMVEHVMKYKKTLYKAAPVASLETLVLDRQKKVVEMEVALASLTETLKKKTKDVIKTEVRYYKGAQGMRQMLWNSLRAEKELVGYSVMGRAQVVGKAFYAKYVTEFKKHGIRDRVIINESPHTLQYVREQVSPLTHQITKDDIRAMPEKDFYVSGDTMIYNNVYAVSYWLNGEVVGVEIENAEFVRSQKDIFKLLWKQAKRVS